MDLHKEYFACLAFKHIPRLGAKVWTEILAHYESAYDAVQDASAWPLLGIECRTMNGFSRHCRTEVWREKAEQEFKSVAKAGMDVVSWFDPRYPGLLKELPDPPLFLYVKGDTTLLRNPGVAVVGARECTAHGLDAAGRISAQLSRIGITVVSGLALGIDRQAHLGGLRGIGSTIGVLGCGLDVDYPEGNRDVRATMYKKGLVVTEFPPGTPALPGHFPHRNRIISGLSLGVLVAEAAHKSGSLITARLAAEQGRDVFALPGPISQATFTGCHRLIKQGASLVENAEDIVQVLRYDFARELAGVPDPTPVSEEDVPDAEEAKVKKKTKRTNNKFGAGADIGRTVEEKKASKPKKRLSAVERDNILLNDEERLVMNLLDKSDRVHIDALGRELDWDSSKVSKILIMLEIRGAVQQMPGMWYLAREAE